MHVRRYSAGRPVCGGDASDGRCYAEGAGHRGGADYGVGSACEAGAQRPDAARDGGAYERGLGIGGDRPHTWEGGEPRREGGACEHM